MNLTENEKNLLKNFIDDYDDVLSNRGCNDLQLENNEENLNILKAAYLLNVNYNDKAYREEYETWIQEYEEKDIFGKPIKPIIITNDGLILDYLRNRLGI